MNLFKHLRPTVLAALALALSACASTPPSEFYMLSPVSVAGQQQRAGTADLSIGVGPAQIPEYLDRPQLVTRSTANRLELDEFHRWGGTLSGNLLRVVAQNLSTLTGSDDVVVYPWEDPVDPVYRVQLSVMSLDGSLGGEVALDAQWVISRGERGSSMATGRSQLVEVTRGTSYDEFVAAQSRLLAELSEEIAAEILTLSGL